MVTIDSLMRLMFEKNASDLHITAGMPPMLRIDGEIVATDLEKIKDETCRTLITSVLSDEQKARLERSGSLLVSFGVEKLGRARMAVFRQRGTLAADLRSIPVRIPAFDQLGLPPILSDIAQLPKGLVLVCGPTGSGKSTTLAAMIDWINEHKSVHILTLEDPLEYLHEHKKSMVNQREIGTDAATFPDALRQAMRQDPDVVLIGELADAETVETALTVAETGHLVFATLNTTDSVQSINYLIDIFSPNVQTKIRTQLSFTLQAVLAQQLLPRGYSSGRVLACEVLIPTSAVRNLIREEKEFQIYSMMQTGSEYGMQTMNQALFDLYQKQLVTYNEIFSRTTDPKDLQNLVKGTT
jgi:twitching motility protein PilT